MNPGNLDGPGTATYQVSRYQRPVVDIDRSRARRRTSDGSFLYNRLGVAPNAGKLSDHHAHGVNHMHAKVHQAPPPDSLLDSRHDISRLGLR